MLYPDPYETDGVCLTHPIHENAPDAWQGVESENQPNPTITKGSNR